MTSIVNIAAYQFAELNGLRELRGELRALCDEQQLRGTILLSTEGVNLFVAGKREAVDALLARLRAISGLEAIKIKENYSEEQPFNRMLVKIKREIIAFGVPGIEPHRYTSKRLAPQELKRWLDEGRPIKLLDTRNNFEVETGTFQNAVAIGVDDFRDFPAAVERLPNAWKDEPIVTFCTGGIRCEKASPFLERSGFRNVYQLDGGILKYFELCGGDHYEGLCFVFDKRVALDPLLQERGYRQCFVCQAILSPTEQASPLYVEDKSCPHCYRSETVARTELLEARRAALKRATTPLPGSVPYDNLRPISVPLRLDGLELLEFLAAMHTQLSSDEWCAVCAAGQLIIRGEQVQPGRIVRAGERLLHTMPATRESDVATDIDILHEDEALVVINKPAPLPMHPCGRFNRNTLSYLLAEAYHPLCLRPAHRLDADTSGVVVFSKTQAVARLVQPQFERQEVRKTYLAKVQGTPSEAEFECSSPLILEPGPSGVRLPDERGEPAVTRFRVLETNHDGTTLLEVEPLTGRTNQIRAHLWKLGLPIVGDNTYLPNQALGTTQAKSIADAPLCLHALSIELTHPITKARVRYEAPLPRFVGSGLALT